MNWPQNDRYQSVEDALDCKLSGTSYYCIYLYYNNIMLAIGIFEKMAIKKFGLPQQSQQQQQQSQQPRKSDLCHK